jgi:biotin operon repressor
VVITVRTGIQESLLTLLKERHATYAHPVNSQTLSEVLNITPSYVREQMSELQKEGIVSVRRGPKGGYYIMTTENTLRLQIDDQVTEHKAGTFADLYSSIVERLQQEGRIITSISLNGVEVLADNIDIFPNEEVKNVLIRTQPFEQFALELTNTALEYLPKLQKGLEQTAGLFQAGNEAEAYALFAQAIDGLGWVDSCLGGLGQWFGARGDHRLLEVHGRYQSQIALLGEAMEDQNYTDAADLLQYELAETVSEAHDLMGMLQEQLAGGKES